MNKDITKVLYFIKNLNLASLLVLAVILILLYLPMLKYDFTYFDDKPIISNNYEKLKSLTISQAFNTDAYLKNPESTFYRPLQNLVFMLDARLGANEPYYFHLSSLIIHFLNCFLLYFLLLYWFKNKTTITLLVILFGIHPIMIFPLSWIPAIGDLIMTSFGFSSFIFLLKFMNKSRWYFLFLHLLFFLFALFSKESAISFLCIWGVYIIFILKQKLLLKKNLILGLGWLICLLIYLYFRSKAITAGYENSFNILSFINNLRTIPEMISRFFIPVQMNPLPHFTLFKTISGLAIIILIIVLALKSKQNMSFVGFGIIWFIFPILPTLFYNHALSDYSYNYLDHRVYFSSAGVLIIIGVLILNIARLKAAISNLIFALLIFCFFILSFYLLKNYKNPITFSGFVLKNNPKDVFAYQIRADYNFYSGNSSTALKDYNSAILIKPDNAKAYLFRGILLYNLHKPFDDILKDYNNAIKYNNYNSSIFAIIYRYRGVLYLDYGLYNKALDDFNRLLSINPGSYLGYYNRAKANYYLKRYEFAVQDYLIVNKLKPDIPDVWYGLAETYFQLKSYENVVLCLNKSIFLNPANSEYYNFRGQAYYNSGNQISACSDWQISASKGNTSAIENLKKFCSTRK